MRKLLGLALLLVAAVAAWSMLGGRDTASAQSRPAAARTATAIFAGGCFWCTESDFDKMPGVISTRSGYTGGRVLNPTYDQVSGGGTGHIEAVEVVYDPSRISYADLTRRFFRTIDPTDSGGSFCDRGYQYRSAIFVADAAQRRIALAERAQAARILRAEVATLILPARTFYPAEAYHQDYYRKNPIRYRYYRSNCGRDARLQTLWRGR